ncbi:unnamed protein product, partial [marine sediment metagenome]
MNTIRINIENSIFSKDFESTNGNYKGLSQYNWNIIINDEQYGNYGFGNNLGISRFHLDTSYANHDYFFEINNLDYSWTNGYYENRITELIPLNDSNYNMYKSESYYSESSGYFWIKPNNNAIEVFNTDPPYNDHATHLENYDDSEWIEMDAGSGHNGLMESYDLGTNTIPRNNVIANITLRINYRGGSGSSNDFKCRLKNGLKYTDYISFDNPSSSFAIYHSTFYNVNFSQSELDSLVIEIVACTTISPNDELLDILWLQCYYYELELNIEIERDITFLDD